MLEVPDESCDPGSNHYQMPRRGKAAMICKEEVDERVLSTKRDCQLGLAGIQ